LLAEKLGKNEDNRINSSSEQNKRQSFYDVQKLSQQVRKRGKKKEPKPIRSHVPDFESDTPIGMRR